MACSSEVDLSTDITVFVLTDNPAAYGEDLNRNDNPPVFVKNVKLLVEKLKGLTVAGLVLELPSVMKASCQDRDRLFYYANTFPVMRVKPDKATKRLAYLDARDCFFKNLEDVSGKRCRSHERMQVRLDCLYAAEDDPVLSAAVQGVILDISPGGCFINSKAVLENESFVHLRINDLEHGRPIFASVRWANTDESEGALPGMGVMFIDLSDEQLEEISALQLTAQTR